MNWESWQAFWNMGGYGLYVWGSFGMTLLCIVCEIGLLRLHHLQVWRQLKRMKSWDPQ